MKYLKLILITAALGFSPVNVFGQKDVMMQAFYWDLPADVENSNGNWWNELNEKSSLLKDAGFTAIWIPSPCKGNFGMADMGYGIHDHYDLGNYFQKGTTETRMGSRPELEDMISAMHGEPRIDVYADIILNHIYGSPEENLEVNPVLKEYVFAEAKRGENQFEPYTCDEIYWRIPDAQPGNYYVKVKGYMLTDLDKGYDFQADWTGSGWTSSVGWETEPNNGNGNNNVFISSGMTMRGRIDPINSDVDEFIITLTEQSDIMMRFTVKAETQNPWSWHTTYQGRGIYPFEVWHNGINLATSTLQACTMTATNYPLHTGPGEANYNWNYKHFHPVDEFDYLTGDGFEDAIVTNTKWFGNDFNTYDPLVQQRLKDWGNWMAETVGFDGFRIDFVRGFQVPFLASWIKNLPLKNDAQRFIVGEYWTGQKYRLKDWISDNAELGADVSVFDFPLKYELNSMCNSDGNYDMRSLNNAGMIRDLYNSVSGLRVVTFLDNHDTGKEHNNWIGKDWQLGYAYTLTHEGRPCVFYSHYFGVEQESYHDHSIKIQAPESLREDIDKLIFARKTYMDGKITVLSAAGNPHPAEDAANVYIARREGNQSTSGAFVVINNHETDTKGLWVDNNTAGYESLEGKMLVNAFNPTEKTQIYADGRVYLSAPARGFAVYVAEEDYVAYGRGVDAAENGNTIPAEYALEQNYPNPFNPATTIRYALPKDGAVRLTIYNLLGQEVTTLVNEYKLKGRYEVKFDASNLSSGMYIYRIDAGSFSDSKRMMLVK